MMYINQLSLLLRPGGKELYTHTKLEMKQIISAAQLYMYNILKTQFFF